MCNEQRFFVCKHCGNIVGMIDDKRVPIVCCGQKMTELVPNTVEASQEKHLPVVKINGDTIIVEIGSIPHPMEEAHHISFVYLQTKHGGQRKCLAVETAPRVCFTLCEDELVAVFAYCNLHGMWKTVL